VGALAVMEGEAMEIFETTREGAALPALGSSEWHPRRYARCRMFKPAHVVLDDAVLDCVLLDVSPGGAQVYLMARAEVPDLVTLWLPDGESRRMRRRWQQGSHIGFEAVGAAVPPS
jgi:PilZ domain